MLLGGLVVATLFTVKATFLIFMAVAIGIGLWEMARAFRANGINVPLVPIAAAGAAMWLCEYWWTNRAVLASLVLGVVAILAWRLTRGPTVTCATSPPASSCWPTCRSRRCSWWPCWPRPTAPAGC